MSKKVNLAIDGPSGAGKSSLAKVVARTLGFIYVDTGAMYRSIALYFINHKVDSSDQKTIVSSLKDINLTISYIDGEQRVILNDEDVTSFIRTPEVSMFASKVSAIPEVRAYLLETQRKLARENSVVMDGRDIATVILPNADVKIFLTANDRKRAERRFEELKTKNPLITFDEVYLDMINRDRNDSTRAVAPAIMAKDAILLDNSDLSEEETWLKAIEIIRNKVEL